MHDVYLGLGGNIGDSYAILQSALKKIEAVPGVEDIRVSRFYVTTPVGGGLPQNNYINAVCQLKTDHNPKQLLTILQDIECQLGKKPKLKNAPRIIDIDILIYGQLSYQDSHLIIPHSHWQERLFVLMPLSDLIEDIKVPCSKQSEVFYHLNLFKMIDSFCNINQESVSLLDVEYAYS
jgi:2-amino-4-hydroxy-6-hydroxymethyldihydropteridine diphosphokinase